MSAQPDLWNALQMEAIRELKRREEAIRREEEMLRDWASSLTLEDVFVKHAGIAASPLQTAICRLADGKSIDGLLSEAERRAFFGIVELPVVRPALVALICGVRGGKSFLSASAAIRSAIRAQCGHLQPHESPRCPIVAPEKDNAKQTFDILVGIIENSPKLSALLVRKTANAVVIQRPDGRKIAIVVVAAGRSGITLRSRWLAGCVFEEVAFFPSEVDGHVINAENLLRAAETRILPNTQVWLVSSPNGPQGLLYDLYKTSHGKPGHALVVTAPTRALNPSFPQETIDALRKRDPDAAAREHDAAWISGMSQFFDVATLDKAERENDERIPKREGAEYVAIMDPATRSNAWTVGVFETFERKHSLVAWQQWQGSKSEPLSPKGVLIEISKLVKPYGIDTVHSDQWSFDSNRDLAAEEEIGIDLVETNLFGSDAYDSYAKLKTIMGEGRWSNPKDPAIRADLISAKKKITSGGPRIELPTTANGRHADYCPILAAAARLVNDEIPDDSPRNVPIVQSLDTMSAGS